MEFYRYLLVLWSVVRTLTVVNASENIALGKTTNQSSVFGDWNSSKAVDGCFLTYVNSGCCTHTVEGEKEVWWQVDLQTQSVIETVKITYRNEGFLHRLAGYEIYLSNTTDWTSGTRCHKDKTANLASMSVEPHVICQGVAQYLTIYNDRRVKQKLWYSDNAILELCEVQVYGCQIGKYGSGNCNNLCVGCLGSICNPTSGICGTCAASYFKSSGHCYPCSQNCLGSQCNNTNGACLGGCSTGFSGTYCQCPANCIDKSCSATGQCSECMDGFYGAACTQCPDGCSSNSGNKCDKSSGNCFECDSAYYGTFCNHSCPLNCKNNVCNMTNGQCTECDSAYYGTFCNHSCPLNCKNNVCNMTNGQCTDGCKTGFLGTFCLCPVNCKESTCSSGQCTDCNDGYYGPVCTPCPSGCSIDTCNKTSGHCIQCDAGYYGNFCSQACPTNCKNNICGMQNGQCIETQAQVNTPNSQVGTYVGAGVGVVVVIAVVIIVVIVVLRRKKLQRKEKEKKYQRAEYNDGLENTSSLPPAKPGRRSHVASKTAMRGYGK